MKKLLSIILIIALFIGCNYNPNPTTNSKTSSENIKKGKDIFITADSVVCKVVKKTEYFVRIETSEPLEKDQLKNIADTLNVDISIIYFHIPGFTGQGEEYGSLIGTMALIFDDFNKNDLEKKQREKAKKEQERIKRVGVVDKEFASKAFSISKDFVKQNLTSPKSADFPFLDYTYSNKINNTIVIKSYVDAKNAFNAEIRTNYIIKLKFLGGDWTETSSWKVLSLEFE